MNHLRTLFAVSIASTSLLVLAACSSSPSSTSSGGGSTSTTGASAIFVAQNPSSGPAQILDFAAASTGNPSPVSIITLPTGVTVGYIAADSAGNIYVSTSTDIREYAAGSTGTATPLRIIPANSTTTIGNTTGLAVDASGNIYVSEYDSGVAVFSSTANGSVAPTRYILNTTQSGGGLSGLYYPYALAADSSGNLYVANYNASSQGSVLVFAAGATGNVAPTRTLNVTASALATDTAGNLYATSYVAAEGTFVAVYASGASGSATPTRTISLNQGEPTGIAVDSASKAYVVTWGTLLNNVIPPDPTVSVYSATSSGTAASTFTSSAWAPGAQPASIAVH